MLSPAPLVAVVLAAIGATTALPQDRLDRRQAVGPWAQCGGNGYTGSKTCTAGYHCQASNEWYSQCVPSAATSSAASTKVSVTTSMTMKTKPVETTKASATSPTSAPASTATGTPFRWLGRVNPSTRELTWPGTGLAFSFTGTSASINIDRATGTNSLQLIVDDLPPKRIDNISDATTITTPSGLSAGKHTAYLRKTSEALFGSVFIPASPITTSGTLNAAPAAKPQRLEILGDSISVGYGVEGSLPCTNTAALENGTATYGAVAARELNADYDIVAWSGKGVVRNLGAGPLLPELWTRWGANDADDSYDFDSRPDPTWVVVNLGTNDFSYLGSRDPLDATVYEQGLVSFGKSIQAEYPDAEVFLTSSPMLSDGYPAGDNQKSTQVAALKGAVETLGAKAHFVDFPTQGSDVGCDYHPTAETQMSLGEILADAIKEVEGS